MFNKARIKLTLWYVLIIMLISISFSIVIFNVSNAEYNRVLKMERLRQMGQWKPQRNVLITFNELGQFTKVPMNPPSPQIQAEARNRLLLILIVINTGIFFFSAAAAYFLAGRTLKPIKDMIEDQNRFITDASHELRTPLTSLKAEIEVGLRDRNFDLIEAKKLLESNLDEVNKLQYLSDHLMKLNKYGVGDDLNIIRVSVKNIATEAIKKIALQARDKQIDIINKTKHTYIFGDEQKLIELLVIFLDNAIKYSPNNNSVYLSSKDERETVLIKIVDQGVGIEKKEVSNIFNRFYRADKARKTQNIGGYGLGLSIAKKIVDIHKGSITVESKVGEGTTFLIRLPKNI